MHDKCMLSLIQMRDVYNCHANHLFQMRSPYFPPTSHHRGMCCETTFCVSVKNHWVCGTYIVHHFNGTKLCCAPSTCICIMHNRPALCTMVGLWDLCCAPLQWYRAMLCTINLHYAQPTCGVHYGAHGSPIF